MANILIRKPSDETHRALHLQARKNERSTEAEIRAVLNEAMLPRMRPLLGTMLQPIAQRFDGVELASAAKTVPEQEPVEPPA